MTPRAALDLGLAELRLTLPDTARAQLMDYVTLLAKWNRTYNLTAIRDPLVMVGHHLLDSLAVVPHLPLPTSGRIADAGSGAGLPGIPLAIARPDWHVALAEANQKKAAFLRQAAIELRLSNVEVHEGRVEAWRPQPRWIPWARSCARCASGTTSRSASSWTAQGPPRPSAGGACPKRP